MGGGGCVGGGGDQGAGTAWKKSKRFHFVLRALRLPLSAASLQGRPHPRARSLVCQLGWTLDRSCLDFEALQPRPVETSSHIHCGFDTICLEQLREVVFSWGNICGCDVMGGKFCALKFKRPPTPLNIGSTRCAGLRRQDHQCNLPIQTVNGLDMTRLCRCLQKSTISKYSSEWGHKIGAVQPECGTQSNVGSG